MSEHFLCTTPLDPRARPLLDDLGREYATRYGDILRTPGEPAEIEKYPPHAFAPPHGNFLLLLRDGECVCGGAFKQFDAQTAEFKRIWTRPDQRRRGLARRLLVELEAQALRQGYLRVYLTTGFRQPEAVGLYLGHGYTALFDTAADPDLPRKLPFEKLLQQTSHARPDPVAHALAAH